MEVKVSSRVGSLRPRRKFPVFVARPTHRAGHCGHQHSSPEGALNCASNNARRNPDLEWSTYRVTPDGSEQRIDSVQWEWNAAESGLQVRVA